LLVPLLQSGEYASESVVRFFSLHPRIGTNDRLRGEGTGRNSRSL